MIQETDRHFNDRRAVEEKKLSEQATEGSQAIAHAQLAKLHAQKADACSGGLAARETPLEITAVDGIVTIRAPDEVTALTPAAAVRTSDRLLARARDAQRQHFPV